MMSFSCYVMSLVLVLYYSLERSNPEEFRKLLERNGMKYDPNYVRGT